MKRFFSTVLCLIFALAMMAMPMVVSADDFTDINETYCLSSVELTLGDNAVTVSDSYSATLFEFPCTDYAEYTISCDDANAKVGAYAGSIHFIPSTAEGTSNTTTLSFAAGNAIIVAVSGTTSCTITIAKSGTVEVEQVLPWVVYENTYEVTPFEEEIDMQTLTAVDTYYDEIANAAVLGEDGYYHLDSAENPIIYVDLNFKTMSVVDIVDNTKLGAVTYNDNGEVIKKIDYTDAAIEYIDNALQLDYNGSAVYLYPLTADLIEMYQSVGNASEWYGADGWVGGEADDAWMFACYYNAEGYVAPSAPVVNDGGSDINASAVPTGNDFLVVEIAVVMMVVLAGAVVVLRKKLAK